MSFRFLLKRDRDADEDRFPFEYAVNRATPTWRFDLVPFSSSAEAIIPTSGDA